jgi:hypothetical protein
MVLLESIRELRKVSFHITRTTPFLVLSIMVKTLTETWLAEEIPTDENLLTKTILSKRFLKLLICVKSDFASRAGTVPDQQFRSNEQKICLNRSDPVTRTV